MGVRHALAVLAGRGVAPCLCQTQRAYAADLSPISHRSLTDLSPISYMCLSLRWGIPRTTHPTDALAAARIAAETATVGTFTATYLEVNCWLLTLGALTILLDPLLEGPLDFQLPYRAAEAIFSASKVDTPFHHAPNPLPPPP